ncbi:sulfite exporter TauE/SafE family protein [Lachnospiraceae bacterium ZAX-1]
MSIESGLKTKKIRILGMTCISCQNKIEKKLRNTAGIQKVEVSYKEETAIVTYDTDILTLRDIEAIIKRLDYDVFSGGKKPVANESAVGILVILLCAYLLLRQFGVLNFFNLFPTAKEGMGYGMLFLIGLLTSVHCVAMCGGINLSQCIPQEGDTKKNSRLGVTRASFLYNFGRVISYTLIGGIVGALGSVIRFSGALTGVVQLIAGAFMIIMGMNMLGIFPALRKFNPRMPRIFSQKVEAEKGKSKSPFYVGLLNGLMPCGPLQAMQIYALSTGSIVGGALSMLLFSLGTVPLMFGLGALSSLLSKKFTHKVMTFGAGLVVVLGLFMFSNGWSLSGISASLNLSSLISGMGGGSSENDVAYTDEIVMENGVQVVNSSIASGRYPPITVVAGSPVKWIIDAPEGSINGCNNKLLIPAYGVEHKFETGENVIEFTPTETGKIPYSCWMGMIRSSITVVEPKNGA